MKKLLTLLGISALLFGFSSCTKSDVMADDADIAGTWAITGIRSDRAFDWDGDGRTETDIYNTYSYCQRDIILTLDYNGGGQARQGCTAPWEPLYWQLSNNNRMLNISLSGDDLNLDIDQISSGQIRGSDQVYVNGNSFIITYTLSRR